MPYGPEIVTPDEIIEEDYNAVTFKEVADQSGIPTSKMVCISEQTKLFLEVICGKSRYNLNVFRMALRNALTAPYEGKNWQSAIYLYGAPATSKSIWAEVFKKLIPKNFIQEFSRTQNQFTPNQLERARVLLVSDLTEISPKQRDVLKRLLGRDTFTKETKFKNEYGLISPYCQVIIISNYPPRHFDMFAHDQALLDKLIRVYLGPELAIKSEHQIADLKNRLDSYCPDLFNWAVHCKSENLRYFIRAVDLNSEFEKDEARGYAGFIQDCVYRKPGEFTDLNTLKEAFSNYCESTGESKMLYEKVSDTQFGSTLVKTFADNFGETYKVVRSKKAIIKTAETTEHNDNDEKEIEIKSKSNKLNKGIRKYGFYDLATTNGKTEVDPNDKSTFVLKRRGSSVELGDPFASDGIVVWFNSALDRIDKNEMQRRIIASREEAELKAAELSAKLTSDELITQKESVEPLNTAPDGDISLFNPDEV